MGKRRDWLLSHRDYFIEFLRVYLGGVLIYKGVFFLRDIEHLLGMIQLANEPYINLALAHYIVFAHLIGGFFLMLGFLTRVVIATQIPILMGAVFVVHIQEGEFGDNSSLEFAMMVLLMLVVFLVYGSGRLSVDHYLETSRPT